MAGVFSKWWNWIVDFFDDSGHLDMASKHTRAINQLYFTQLAIDRASSVIGRNLAKCEFEIFRNGEPFKKEEWYSWNVRPNKNESATYFKKRIAEKLIKTGECLIIRNNDGDYLIADSYSHEQRGNINDIFDSVTVKDFTFAYPFYMDQVIFYKLESEGQIELMDTVFTGYLKVLNHAIEAYNMSYLTKIKVRLNSTFNNGSKDGDVETIFNDLLADFMSDSSCAIPEYEGTEYVDFGSTKSTIPSSDIISLRKDCFDFVANCLGIPQTFLEGDTQDIDKDVSELMTNCLIPIINEIETATNFALFSKSELLNGTRMKVSYRHIKYIDMFTLATSIDKLIASGFASIDEVRDDANLPIINEEWSNKHYMTKNYDTAENIITEVDDNEINDADTQE